MHPSGSTGGVPAPGSTGSLRNKSCRRTPSPSHGFHSLESSGIRLRPAGRNVRHSPRMPGEIGGDPCRRLGWWGRAYFALQALAGALWWAAVAVSPTVRTATLGGLDPALVAAFDIPLFVMGSAAAAAGVRAAAAVAAAWSTVVTIGLGAYATVTTQAGAGALIMAAAAAASIAALCLAWWGRIPVDWIIRGPFAFRPARQRSARFHVAATFGQIVLFWGFFLGILPPVPGLPRAALGTGCCFSPSGRRRRCGGPDPGQRARHLVCHFDVHHGKWDTGARRHGHHAGSCRPVPLDTQSDGSGRRCAGRSKPASAAALRHTARQYRAGSPPSAGRRHSPLVGTPGNGCGPGRCRGPPPADRRRDPRPESHRKNIPIRTHPQASRLRIPVEISSQS